MTVEPKKHQNQHPPALTKAKQDTYLHTLAQTGIHGSSCKQASIDISTPFQWAYKNEQFRKRLEDARAKGEAVLLAKYETTLDDYVLGIDNFEDFVKGQVIRMFRMKRLDPRYRDNAVVNVQAVGPVAIQLNFGQAPQAMTTSSDEDPEKHRAST